MTKKRQPLVSILIVNWNGKDILIDCLKSINKLTYSNYEIILVDNGSTDGSIEEASKYLKLNKAHKILLNKHNRGFAPANNQGLKLSKGKYILLLNNDTKVSSNLLTRLVEKMDKDPSIGAMQPKIKMMDNPELLDNAGSFLNSLGFTNHWGFGQKDGSKFNQEREIFAAKGACLMTKREVVKAAGLFDNDFVSYFEESDFCWRVWLAGYRVIYFPAVSITHKVGFSSKKLSQVEVNYHGIKNRILSFIKNFEITNLFIMLTKHFLILFSLSFYYLIKFQPKKSYMIIKAIFWNIKSLSKSLAKRKYIQERIKKVSDSQIFPIILQETSFVDLFNHFRKVEKNFVK